MYTELFQELGLAQNEAKIYETLLTEGESPVGLIANKSKVHRRNVYDSLNRLVEKGLVFEIIQHRENHYQAVEPGKLVESLEEKRRALNKELPNLIELYNATPHNQEVYISKGMEGWKNYMREVLRIGGDVHVIGAKAQLNSPRLKSFFPSFNAERERKGIKFHNLYDHEVKGTHHIGFIGEECRFLPKKYSSVATVSILKDRVFYFPGITVGDFNEDFAFTVIVNQQIASAHLKWWQFMWDMCKPEKKIKTGLVSVD